MMLSRVTSRQWLLGALSLSLSFVMACGDDDGGGTTVDTSNGTTASNTTASNTTASNTTASNTTTGTTGTTTPELGTIPEVAAEAGSFATLLTALETAGLDDDLAGAGPFTVFAPTDAAFAALLEELEIDAATLLARDDLGDILSYHVAMGELLAAGLSDGQTIPTLLEGEELTITADANGV
ncbi:MAG: fasciclin domain-containing protein, partial [Myxococcota bacterium]